MSHRVLSIVVAVLMMLPPCPSVALARNDLETSSPVNTVNREAIETTSVQNVADVLTSLPGMTGGDVKSSRGDSIDWNSVPVTLDGVRLRGLDGAGNLDQALIERVEVLKDGASAVYGSDAVSGVVNVATRAETTPLDALSGLSTQREYPGEAYGLGGMVVATGRNGRETGAAFFTPGGVPYGYVPASGFRGDAAQGLAAMQHGCYITARDPMVRDLGKMFADPHGPAITIGKGKIVVGGKSTLFDDWSEGRPQIGRGNGGGPSLLSDMGYPRIATDSGAPAITYPLDYKWSPRVGLGPSLQWTDRGPTGIDRPDDRNQRLNLPPLNYNFLDSHKTGGMTQIDPPTIIPIGDQASGGGLRQDAGGPRPTRDDVVTDSDVDHGMKKLTPEQQREMERMGLTPQRPGTTTTTPPSGASNTGSPSGPAATTPQGTGIVDELERARRTAPLNPHQPAGDPQTSKTSDGGQMRQWRDGTTEITRPDGSQDVTYPDGSRFHRNPDGSVVDTTRDGTRVTRDANGTETGRTQAGRDETVIRDPHSTSTEPPRDLMQEAQRKAEQARTGQKSAERSNKKKSANKKSDKRFKGAGAGQPKAKVTKTEASTVDADGNRTTIAKQPDGSVLRTVTNAQGDILQQGTLAPPEPTRVKPKKDESTFVSTPNADGGRTTVAMAPDGTMTRTVTDAAGHTVSSAPIAPEPPTQTARPRQPDSASTTDADGNTVTVTRQPDGSQRMTVVNPEGQTIADGPLAPPEPTRVPPRQPGQTSASTTDGNGNTTTITKNPDGTTTRTVTDRNGNVTEQGRVTPPEPTLPQRPARQPGEWSASATDLNGNTTTIKHNADGSTTRTVRGPDGTVLEDGPMTPPPPTKVPPRQPGTTEASVSNPDGTTTTIKKNPDGTTTRTVRDANGNTISSEPVTPPPPTKVPPRQPGTTEASTTDAQGNTTTIKKNPDGSTTRTVTDAQGNTLESGPLPTPPPSVPARPPRQPGHWSASSTDANGNTTTITGKPDGSKTRTVTNRNGDIIEQGPVTEPAPTLPRPRGATSVSTTDAQGNTITITKQPDGQQTMVVHNPQADVIAQGAIPVPAKVEVQPAVEVPLTPSGAADPAQDVRVVQEPVFTPGTQPTYDWTQYVQDRWLPGLPGQLGGKLGKQDFAYPGPEKDAKIGYAPRLGMAYDWSVDGKVSAGYGRFYDAVPAAPAGDVQIDPAMLEYFSKPAWERNPFRNPWEIGPSGPSYANEFTTGAEYEVLEDLRTGLTGQYRRMGQQIEDMSTDGGTNYILGNPAEFGVRIGDMTYSNVGTYRTGKISGNPPGYLPPSTAFGSGFTPERIAEIAREDAEITRDFTLGQPSTPMAGFDLERALRGFEPQQVMVMPNGCAAASKAQRLEDIRTMLGGNTPADDPRIYLIEAIFWRWWQLVPNDPDYRASEEAKQAAEGEKRRKEFVKHRRNLTELSAFGGQTTTKDFGPQHGPVKDKALDQWGLQLIGMEQAWDIEDGSQPNVIVAVIDSGLDLAHPDGPQYVWTNPKEQAGNGVDDDGNGYVDDVHGWNFFDENNDLTDTKGHGTLVAGIIAAKRNNGIGIAGINPGARIMPLKVTDNVKPAHSLNIYRAIHYAVRHGARVINISLGDQGLSKLEQLAVNYAHAMGVVVVVASGNQAGDVAQHGPAGLRRVLAVGALNMKGEVAGISNRGANLGLIAPGEQIYSLHSKDAEWPGAALERERHTTAATGTSFSAPIVAGIASLMLAKSPGLPNRLVEDILLDSAGGAAWDAEAGAGLVNAPKALQASLDGLMTVRPTEVLVHREKKRVSAVDVFGIVRGVFADYRVELGKGREPSEWQAVAGPIGEPVEYGLIARIPGEALAKSKEWTVRITATDRRGRTKSATLPLAL